MTQTQRAVMQDVQHILKTEAYATIAVEKAEAILRAALAELEVEQEPVAITTKTQIEEMQHGYSRAIVGRDPKFWLVKRDDDVPLYTAAPRREWQSLTDEEIEDLYFDGFSLSKLNEFARAIEAALKEKNQ